MELNKISQLSLFLTDDNETMDDTKTHLTRARKGWMNWQSQGSLASIKRWNAEHPAEMRAHVNEQCAQTPQGANKCRHATSTENDRVE
jgi:hypothetical protein